MDDRQTAPLIRPAQTDIYGFTWHLGSIQEHLTSFKQDNSPGHQPEMRRKMRRVEALAYNLLVQFKQVSLPHYRDTADSQWCTTWRDNQFWHDWAREMATLMVSASDDLHLEERIRHQQSSAGNAVVVTVDDA
jgi:hypothetical protein